MTNPSPPEPQNPIPERRRRPATGVTFDEMIAIIVAFSTIGTILFWSMGGKNSKLANNLGLGGSSNLLASDQTLDTGLGFGNILSANTDADVNLNQDLEVENRRLAAELAQQETEVSFIPPNQVVRSQPVAKNSYAFDSGAKLVPLAGVASLPALKNQSISNQNIGNSNASVGTIDIEEEESITPERSATQPSAIVPEPAELETSQPENAEPRSTEPSTATPPETETTIQPEPTAITPETTKMPEDVVPDYWAYPFVKQMREQALVPELAKNQEFEPDALITRASMATLVSQAFKQQPATASIKKFKDVSNQNAIAKDIDQAVRMGFMQGYSDDEFKPLENIPRYQVLVTLATGLGLQPSQDADQILRQFGGSSKMPEWAKQQVAAAAEAGLIVNPPDAPENALIPEKPATRGEVAAMIHQALVSTGQLEPLESEYIVKP
ncbi:MAG: S-layer homology domain-containing protein [Cyanobacteria bacterium P01_E01_bin.35]